MAALVTYLLTPVAKRIAFLLGAVDQPGERKIHKVPMARLGGLAVFAGFCAPWVALYFLGNRISLIFQDYERLFGSLMTGATMMFVLGFYDDVRGANAQKKFLVQVFTAVLLWFNGFRITEVSVPFSGVWHLGMLSLPFSVLWIVGITNAMNLLDGIDGLVSGVTVCIALSLGIINIYYGKVLIALLTLCLAGACLGFLPHNFSPAKIFMGDAGSLFIGMVLSCIGVLSLFKVVTTTFVAVPVLMFGLPLYDTLSVMLGRAMRGKHIFQADKTHIHHRLLQLGWHQKKAVFFLYGICLVLSFLAIDITINQNSSNLLFGLGLLLVIGLRLYRLYRAKLREDAAQEAAGRKS